MSTVPGLPEYAQYDLVDRLHKSLRFAGIKPGAMADHLGLHRNTVGGYLRGAPIDRRTLIAWALRCGVPYGWLATGEMTTEGPNGPSGQEIRTRAWDADVVDLRARKEHALIPHRRAA